MISVLIIVKNEADVIEGALRSAEFADEVVLVDGGSTDQTLEIAKKFKNVRVSNFEGDGWDKRRNYALNEAKGDWVFYLDADERITDSLKEEVLLVIAGNSYEAYKMPRKNFMLGRWLMYGGWYPDHQTRLIKRSALKMWQGNIHESPVIEGKVGLLKNDLIHLTHRSITAGINKMVSWSRIEATLRYEQNHPKITFPRIVKASVLEFIYRFFRKSGWKDGIEGALESAIQAINIFFIYAQLWELQRKESMKETYQKIDKDLDL